jgi:hypothetical protein
MAGPQHVAREQRIDSPRPAPQPSVQRRLRVGAVDDPLEREADAVADRLVASLDAGEGAPSTSTVSRIRRVATADAPPIGAEGGGLDGDTESILNSQLGRGRALDGASRATLEPHFGADFSSVRVHDDGVSQDLNRRMSAQAFTLGSDIFFSGTAPDTSSAAGQSLLAHELTHVVQQGGAARRRIGPEAPQPDVDANAPAPSKVRRRPAR